jgi:hypothetical protein
MQKAMENEPTTAQLHTGMIFTMLRKAARPQKVHTT